MLEVRRITALLACAGVLALLPAAPAVAAPQPAAASAWTPPPGYVLEGTYLGPTWCDEVGSAGVEDGRWADYVCNDVLIRLTDLYMLYGQLYVRR
ncbi:hypothetical protein Misp01_62130 [Microtetraspora sp. NBRC 13810]|uniref:hypothetical protein n=1 Tax=Microtetraspora sp. NBRC 13810 TaxID=3030990 RepID=UPI0024A0B1FD|nr:hypothetical protein [Microtetraspora sp. NBRC 13810]GLW11085.1 hypothetical protein Misp01_62130 [Microtetraspora sp. NBRC 13810]